MLARSGLHYLDTNVLIYALESSPVMGEKAYQVLHEIETGEGRAATCSLTLSELLVQPFRTNNSELIECYLQIFSSSGVVQEIPLARNVLVQAARLGANYPIKLPDAIHAAAAIEHHCATFVTADKRFTQIDGLKVHLLQ